MKRVLSSVLENPKTFLILVSKGIAKPVEMYLPINLFLILSQTKKRTRTSEPHHNTKFIYVPVFLPKTNISEEKIKAIWEKIENILDLIIIKRDCRAMGCFNT